MHIFLASTLIVFALTTPQNAYASSPQSGNSAGLSDTNQLVITYESGQGGKNPNHDIKLKETLDDLSIIDQKPLGNGTYLVSLSSNESPKNLEQISDNIQALPQIRSAEPNIAIHLADELLPNSNMDISSKTKSVYSKSNLVSRDLTSTNSVNRWGLDRIDQRSLPLNGTYIYDSSGIGVDAYVIDTGIRRSHNIFNTTPSHIADGFSLFDDAGALAATGAPTTTEDCDGHGTHVSGILGSQDFGVASDVTLIPVRVMGCNNNPSDVATILTGINWVISDHLEKSALAGHNVPAVANMSLELVDETDSQVIVESLDYLVKAMILQGITVVVASGNANADACNGSPANVPEALTVSASEATDVRAPFSNYGTCTDIYAPGTDIWSASITDDNGVPSDGYVVALDGTSMAAPMVAGVAAKILEEHPTYSPSKVTAQIMAMSTFNPAISLESGDNKNLLFSPTSSVWQTDKFNPTNIALVKAQTAAKVAYNSSIPGVTKSLKIKKLSHRKLDISVAAPKNSKILIQRKSYGKWKTLKTYVATKHRVVSLSRSGTYRVKIVIPKGTITTKTYKFN